MKDKPTIQAKDTIQIEVEEVFLTVDPNSNKIKEHPWGEAHPLIVNARIKCKNSLVAGGTYLSEELIEFIAAGDGHTLVNKLQIMDKFIFPKEVLFVSMGYYRF